MSRILYLIAALLILGFGCAPAQKPATAPGIEVKVLALNFNPRLPNRNNQFAHQAFDWNHARTLSEAYQAAVDSLSGGYIRYRLVEWRNVNAFPVKEDGFQYTPETFVACWTNRETCHDPDGSDYPLLLETYGVVPRINSGEIDEVWIFGAPFFGFWEAAMAGPEAFDINGGVYPDVPASHRFAIMGFSYERGLAEMLHNLCHRTEATMTRQYGGWKSDELTSNWARFAANAHQSNGVAAVGSCHYPPNGEEDYDYDNPREVVSSAGDWLDYPNLTSREGPLTRDAWGGPDYQLNYMQWWFAHLPRAEGTNEDGHLNNWWTYVFDLE